jgi:hypothetical protein
VIGYARESFRIVGDILSPIEETWSFDAENHQPKAKKPRK